MDHKLFNLHVVTNSSPGFRWLIAFIRMTRPLQIVAVTLVYALGMLVTMNRLTSVEVSKVIWGYLLLIPGIISIHLANEFSDFETDRLTRRTWFSGGSGALHDMGLNPDGALLLAKLWVGITGILAVFGVFTGNVSMTSVVLLCIGIVAGWAYSIPPLQLAWRGWGELLNATLGAFLLPLYGSTIISGKIEYSILLVMVPFACLTFNNLLATTYADRLADRTVGKLTLATRHSSTHLRIMYLSALACSVLSTLFLPLSLMPSSVKWLSLLASLAAIWGWQTYTFREDPLPSVSAMSLLLVAQLVGFLMESKIYEMLMH